YTAGEGEFAGLTGPEALLRLALGRAWFGEQDWPLEGFVAPAWLLGKGAWQALRAGGFSYTTTLSSFHLLAPAAAVRAPCIVYSTRSPTRRALSLAWNAGLLRLMDSARLARLALHPADALYPQLVRQAQALLEHLLRDRIPMTKAEFAGGLRATLGRQAARHLSPPRAR
ncbi:MAG: DUF2334 domain-containing protein, partial [Zoogloea sp.]|nr:DUF2334 domain-containing protein [Zoogloea sp.]